MLKPLAIRAAMTMVQPFYGGVGSIHALHRIVPEAERSRLGDNRALEITPQDLDQALLWFKEAHYDFVTLDEVPERLATRTKRKFTCITLDDGYRDNLQHGLPVFEKHGVPFAVNITTAFSDHADCVWWYGLEELIFEREDLEFSFADRAFRFNLRTKSERESAFIQLSRLIRYDVQSRREEFLHALFAGSAVDPLAVARRLVMDWSEVARLASSPLVTLGAHGIHHYTSALLDESALRAEFAGSARIIAERTGRTIRHLAYPFGGRGAVDAREFAIAKDCGFLTMSTTRVANLFPEHRHLLDRLPRLILSGNYPVISCLERLETGLNAFRAYHGKRIVTE